MPNPAITAHLSAVRELAASLDRAEAIQWDAAPIPKPREDTSSRALGGHSDPTGDIALDGRRQRVRGALGIAEAMLHTTARELSGMAERVDEAVAHWSGDTP